VSSIPRTGHVIAIRVNADTPEAVLAIGSLVRRLFPLSTESGVMKNDKPPPGYRVYIEAVVLDLDIQEILGSLEEIKLGGDRSVERGTIPIEGSREAGVPAEPVRRRGT